MIEAGRIVERGTHRDLLAAGGRYAQLYRTQFDQQSTATDATDPASTGNPSPPAKDLVIPAA